MCLERKIAKIIHLIVGFSTQILWRSCLHFIFSRWTMFDMSEECLGNSRVGKVFICSRKRTRDGEFTSPSCVKINVEKRIPTLAVGGANVTSKPILIQYCNQTAIWLSSWGEVSSTSVVNKWWSERYRWVKFESSNYNLLEWIAQKRDFPRTAFQYFL